MRGPPVCLRELTAEEASAVENLARSRTAAALRVERARMVLRASPACQPRRDAPQHCRGAWGECRDGAPTHSAVQR